MLRSEVVQLKTWQLIKEVDGSIIDGLLHEGIFFFFFKESFFEPIKQM